MQEKEIELLDCQGSVSNYSGVTIAANNYILLFCFSFFVYTLYLINNIDILTQIKVVFIEYSYIFYYIMYIHAEGLTFMNGRLYLVIVKLRELLGQPSYSCICRFKSCIIITDPMLVIQREKNKYF